MSTIKLLTNDKIIYTVDVEVAKMSTTIKTMLEDLGTHDLDKEVIPLPNVSGVALEKIIEWAVHHKDDPDINKETEHTIKNPKTMYMDEWDRRFLQIDSKDLFRLVTAANYLEVKGLLELCCKNMVMMIKGKSIQEMREFFGFPPKKIEKTEPNANINNKTNYDYSADNQQRAEREKEDKSEKSSKISCDDLLEDRLTASEKEEETDKGSQGSFDDLISERYFASEKDDDEDEDEEEDCDDDDEVDDEDDD